MAAKFQSIKVSQLIIDHLQNPRHNPLEDEPAAIAQLYRPEKVHALAKHIAQNGLNPLERLAVTPHPNLPKFYVALEGNRRACALKLLRDPMRAPDSRAQREMQAVVEGATVIPTHVEVAIFDERALAREWLRIKHRGSLGGIGTRHWTPTQDTRFDAQLEQGRPNPNAQALALLDYAQKIGLLSEDSRGLISLTTMTRYLSTPAVRASLGLVNGHDLMRNAPSQEFDRALGRFLRDQLPQGEEKPKLTSRTHLKASDRTKYAEEISEDGDGVTTKLPASEEATPVVPSSKQRTGGKRTTPHPGKRRYVVTPDFRLTNKNPILRRLFEELRTIDPEPNAYPFSANYLLRAFIEQVVVMYAKKHNVGHNGDLHIVVTRCADHLKGDGVEDRVLKPLRTHASEQHHWSSVHTLGAAVHGNSIPKESTLKTTWESLQPSLQAMLDRL